MAANCFECTWNDQPRPCYFLTSMASNVRSAAGRVSAGNGWGLKDFVTSIFCSASDVGLYFENVAKRKRMLLLWKSRN